MPQPSVHKIVDDNGNVVDELEGLSLLKAEAKLTDLLNEGADVYIQDDD